MLPPIRLAVEVAERPVDRVDHPVDAAAAGRLTGLFTKDAVCRPMPRHHRPYGLLDLSVCLADQVMGTGLLLYQQLVGPLPPRQCQLGRGQSRFPCDQQQLLGCGTRVAVRDRVGGLHVATLAQPSVELRSLNRARRTDIRGARR